MGDTFALSALDRKRNEIARAIDEAETRLEFLRASLIHLDAVVGLFDRERDAPGTEPVLGRPDARYFQRGELSRLVMEAMRLNPGAAPIVVARIVMEQRGVGSTDRVAIYLVRKSVGRIMRMVRKRLAG
ncbi:hypothetical protein STVA_07010 [Allostella vacuolata]|nr:hypothetical protein STVA_07010 [Stella vacuolata]